MNQWLSLLILCLDLNRDPREVYSHTFRHRQITLFVRANLQTVGPASFICPYSENLLRNNLWKIFWSFVNVEIRSKGCGNSPGEDLGNNLTAPLQHAPPIRYVSLFIVGGVVSWSSRVRCSKQSETSTDGNAKRCMQPRSAFVLLLARE